MKSFKTRLTKIKGLMEAKLPDGADTYGYPGVSKDMLVRTCQDMYDLANEIEAKDDSHQFEIIVLKRFEVGIQEDLKGFLEKDADGGKAKEKFNGFLDRFSALYEKTKQVYFIVNKNGIRDDAEIGNLRAQIEGLKARQAEYEGVIGALETQAKTATARAAVIELALKSSTDQIQANETNCVAAAAEVEKCHQAVAGWNTTISQVHQNMAGWDLEAKQTLEATKANEKQTSELVRQLSGGIVELNKVTEKSASLTADTLTTHERNLSLIKEIQDTLGDANRVGMAASFKEQMEAMKKAQDQWKLIFIGTIGVFVLVAGTIILMHLSAGSSTWYSVLFRLPIMTPIVWLAWFAARQYGFTNRVREDYAYKYSSAMAYEGFKKAVRETDSELEKSLIEVAILNLSQNPIRLYDPKHSDHASPFSEMWEKMVGGKVKGIKAGVSKDSASAAVKFE